LVPAFEYADGVGRILAACAPGHPSCEVIVSDDSRDDSVREVVERVSARIHGLTYVRNRPALGAVENWNALLGMARGRYCLLLHHDEFPLCQGFPARLAHSLQCAKNPDVLVLGCVLVDERSGRNRVHLPGLLREEVVRNHPRYLFRRNVIGPPSVVVARRAVYPRFDPMLRWLVDVDVYYQLFAAPVSIAFDHLLRVGSLSGRAESITASLRPALRDLRKRELAYLAQKHGLDIARSGLERRRGRLLAQLGEDIAWKAFRILSRGASAMLPSPVPPSLVRALITGPLP
jgi:glycosyltransferase involved in cell wall biosynthesis